MPAWLQSLDSVVRAVTMLSVAGVGFALLATLCGAAAFYLNRQAQSLRDGQTEQVIAAATATLTEQHQQEVSELQRRVDESVELLVASEERSEGFLDRLESLERELESARAGSRRPSRPQPVTSRPAAAARQDPSQAPPASTPGTVRQPPDEGAGGDALTNEHLERIRRALSGKPAGEITLVSVVGQPSSARRAEQLQNLLSELGWQVQMIQGVFPNPPAECSFVVHGPDSIPETASSLSVALAMVNLMSLPVKVVINAQRPPGFLGLIVAPAR